MPDDNTQDLPDDEASTIETPAPEEPVTEPPVTPEPVVVEQKVAVVGGGSTPATPRFLHPAVPTPAQAPKAAVVAPSKPRPVSPVDAVEALFDATKDPILAPLAVTLRRYANDMKTGTEVSDEVIRRSQRLLYMTIMDTLNRQDPQVFRKLWQYILAFAHHHRNDVFGPKAVFRGGSVWYGDNESLDIFHSLLNLITATADPATRSAGLKTVSLTTTLSRIKSESARNQMIAFYR